MKGFYPSILLVALGHFVDDAKATWSIIATDRATGQVGVVATTCRAVSTNDCTDPTTFIQDYEFVPGRGVAAAQDIALPSQADIAADTLAGDDTATPQEAVSSAVQNRGDQIAVVDMSDSFVHTGIATSSWSGDTKGQKRPDYIYSVQGNDLTSEEVIKQAKKKFSKGGCDLADKLMRGLVAGSRGGEGDVDCPEGRTSTNIGYLHVVNPDNTTVVDLFVGIECDTDGTSAVKALKEKYIEWRNENECLKRPLPHERYLPPLHRRGQIAATVAVVVVLAAIGFAARKRYRCCTQADLDLDEILENDLVDAETKTPCTRYVVRDIRDGVYYLERA